MIGTLIVTVCYIAFNASICRTAARGVVKSTRVAADAAEAVLGGGAARWPRSWCSRRRRHDRDRAGRAARVLAMAHDGLLFRWLGSVHPRYQTPHLAIVAPGRLVVRAGVTGTYRAALHPGGLHGVDLLRADGRGPVPPAPSAGLQPAYRMGAFRCCRALRRASLAIVINQFVSTPAEAAIGLGLVAAGAPIYYLRHAYR